MAYPLNHDVEAAAKLLVQSISDQLIGESVRRQLAQHVLNGSPYWALHNRTRYPMSDRCGDQFCRLEISEEDVEELKRRLTWIKSYVKGLK